MKYISIKNLENYHPGYKDRELKWCKTYFTMINADPEFEMLCEIDKWRYVTFIMMELQSKKPIPADEQYLIRKGFDFKKRKLTLTLDMLQKFIVVVTEDGTLPYLEAVTQSREEVEVEKRRGEEIAASATSVWDNLFKTLTPTESLKANSILDYLESAVCTTIKLDLTPQNKISLIKLIRTFPNTDILKEFKKADNWLFTNKKHKTDYMKFLTNWLNRADRG